MKTFLPLTLAVSLTACASSQVAPTAARPTSTVVLASEAKWEQLNPARGDESPQAATLWGDRNGSGPTGFVFHPVDGFQSPPHAHNVSYRGVVIRGLVHNDDPDAEEMWMPAGSYWTQPKGGVHITAAKGNDILAYIEIEEGPYLVLPVEKAFENEDEPSNVHESKIVWTDLPSTSGAQNGLEVARLWGNPLDATPSGSLVRLPAGFSRALRTYGASFRAVVIKGRPTRGLTHSGVSDKKLCPRQSDWGTFGARCERRFTSSTRLDTAARECGRGRSSRRAGELRLPAKTSESRSALGMREKSPPRPLATTRWWPLAGTARSAR